MSLMRRRKLLCVEPQFVLGLLDGSLLQHEIIQVPNFRGLPKGAIVKGVQFDFNRNAFVLQVLHKSFPEVPDGQEPPQLFGSWELARRKVKRNADAKRISGG